MRADYFGISGEDLRMQSDEYFEILDKQMQGYEVGSGNLAACLPYLKPERFPSLPNGNFVLDGVSRQLHQTRPFMYRLLFESITYAYVGKGIECLEKLGVNIGSIAFSGGLTKCKEWFHWINQLTDGKYDLFSVADPDLAATKGAGIYGLYCAVKALSRGL